MKVNHNMSAVITNAQLLRTEGSLADSMERLASGLKINHAKDDPSGMAIGNKMQAQIEGLEQASANASNGTSVIQIADGALNEVSSMLTRMRELSVQAANDTNTDYEKDAMQDELSALREEIDRVSRDTEYNTKNLLDGSADIRVYASHASNIRTSDAVPAGDYGITITSAATQASLLGTATSTTGIPAGKVVINGYEVEIDGTEDAASLYEKLRKGAERGGVDLFVTDDTTQDLDTYPQTGGYEKANRNFAFGDSLALVSKEYGATAPMDITCSSPQLATALGLDPTTVIDGTDAVIVIDRTTSFSQQATVSANGNDVIISDNGGFSLGFSVEPGFKAGGTETGDINFDVTQIGAMAIQIGANENQTMEVRIPEVSSTSLNLNKIELGTVSGPGDAISIIDDAISQVSTVRAKLGAYENRLDYAVEGLNTSNENMTQAISRIQDSDMAKEMSEYTKFSVLDQAGISVLAQANDLPQTVLQLLQ